MFVRAIVVASVALAVIALSVFMVQRGLRESPAPGPSHVTDHSRKSVRLSRIATRLAEGVYLLGDLFPSVVYAVDTELGLVLIDSGLEEQHDKLIRGLAALDLDVGRLQAILLTHAHGDHSMGAMRLRQDTGAKICVGRADAEPLRRGGSWEAIFSKFDVSGVQIHPTLVDVELDDGQVLTWGNARFTAIGTPGHTPGSFCYLLERAGQRFLFTGDTVMSLSALGTYATYLPPKYRGDLHGYLNSLHKLLRIPAPDLVLPGHPEADAIPQDARITPTRWTALLSRGIAELERLEKRYESDGADFLDGTPRELCEGVFYLGDWEGRASYAFLKGSHCLLFDAPGGDRALERFVAAWSALGIDEPVTIAVLLTSCDSASMSGLRAITEQFRCRVFAAPSGAALVSRCCSPATRIVSIDDLAELEWHGINAILTPGIDDTAVAYQFRAGGDVVLVTGSYPLEIDTQGLKNPVEVSGTRKLNVERWLTSLETLGAMKPNLWLTPHPLYGRNANLYDDEWQRTVSYNRRRTLAAGRNQP